MAKVYVSSTVADLRQERRAVLDWLRMAGHGTVESYLPNSETVRDSCLDDVGTCDLYVLIVGHQYGFSPAEGNPEGLSITHLEFRRAGECGVPRIALLRMNIPDLSLSDIADPQKLALVLTFRDEVAHEVPAVQFSDQESLIQGLSSAVENELAKLSARGPRRGIFLSYRREDAAAYALLLRSKLRERFPDARVFMDLDSIEGGADFAKVIQEAVGSSAVLVALIGRQWATLADDQERPRLDDPNDFVRFELRTALQRRVRVVPVLVDGAKPLRQEQLPQELHQLARLNAFELSYDRYEDDVGRLVDLIQGLLGVESGAAHQPAIAADPGSQACTDSHAVRLDEKGAGEATREGLEQVRNNLARVTRVLAEAERLAQSLLVSNEKAVTLAEVARAMAATDRDHADQLNADAEGVVQSMADDDMMKVTALANVVEVLAATDPDRAARLIGDAERIAESTSQDPSSPYGWMAVADVAKAMAAIDLDRAERLALSLTDEFRKPQVLASIVEVLAATDPDRASWRIGDAERIARSISTVGYMPEKSAALANVGKALAATDPDRASWLIDDAADLAQSLPESVNATALVSVARAMAATDPDRAADIAQSITDESSKATALADVAGALAATDPDRAADIAQSITDESSKATALADVAGALAATDPDRAALLIREAERTTRSITDEYPKGMVLVNVVRSLAVIDPNRAEYVARSITDESWRIRALLAIAEA